MENQSDEIKPLLGNMLKGDTMPNGDNIINTRNNKVTIKMSTQQYAVLDRVRNEGILGNEDSEILRNILLDWIEKKSKKIEPISTIGHQRDHSTD